MWFLGMQIHSWSVKTVSSVHSRQTTCTHIWRSFRQICSEIGSRQPPAIIDRNHFPLTDWSSIFLFQAMVRQRLTHLRAIVIVASSVSYILYLEYHRHRTKIGWLYRHNRRYWFHIFGLVLSTFRSQVLRKSQLNCWCQLNSHPRDFPLAIHFCVRFQCLPATKSFWRNQWAKCWPYCDHAQKAMSYRSLHVCERIRNVVMWNEWISSVRCISPVENFGAKNVKC